MSGSLNSEALWVQEQETGRWLRFDRQRGVVTAGRTCDVAAALAEVEERVEAEGLWAVGWVSYEAAPAFDAALATQVPGEVPLLYFVLCDAPEYGELPAMTPAAEKAGGWQRDVTREAYGSGIARVLGQIEEGETYQVNYTHRLTSAAEEDLFAQFVAMNRSQRGRLGAYIDSGRWVVASASPELFFSLNGSVLESRPMKGTAARRPEPDADAAQAEWLRTSAKNRAENVMIVDMLRNDMGRIARSGSVHVPQLLTVERYPTVWQMTSTVQCETDVGLAEVFGALFPCASITGAPKRRTMGIIRELEGGPRGVYTGAVGFVAPGRRAQFNVAIRTVVTDRVRGVSEYGVGGGIVWDSEAASEFRECEAKARVLVHREEPFSLLETMLWRPGEGIVLRARHLRRLSRSCGYFGIGFDGVRIGVQLEQAVAGRVEPVCLRLLLDQEGECVVQVRDLPGSVAGARRIALAREPVQSDDLFLYHKTTRRGVYDRARAERPDVDDVLLWNERGELTETTIANVIVELNGERVTPPVSCGLLAGTQREELLSSGGVRERIVRVEELAAATRIWLVNSVRGEQVAVLVD